MNPHEVQGLVDEVVAQRLEQTLHQGHAEAVNSWPAGGVLGLSGEALLKENNSFQVKKAKKKNAPMRGKRLLFPTCDAFKDPS